MKVDTIEFKYESTPENSIAQLAGKLRGMKPLNRSKIVPIVDGNSLQLHISHLDQGFFNPGEQNTRDDAYTILHKMLSETVVWVKIGKRKFIKSPSNEVQRVASDDKLIIRFQVEEV